MNNDYNGKNSRGQIRKYKQKGGDSNTALIITAAVLCVLAVIAITAFILIMTGVIKIGGTPSVTDDPNSSDVTPSVSDPATNPPDTTETPAVTDPVSTAPSTSGNTPGTLEPTTTKPAPTEEPEFGENTIPRLNIYSGSLVLVDSKHEFNFNLAEKPLNVYSNKNSAYMLSGTDLMLNKAAIEALNKMLSDFKTVSGYDNVLVTGAYRSYDEQDALYKKNLAAYGQSYVDKYSAKAGYSDFHTGNSFVLKVYTDQGKVETLDRAGAAYDWIVKNSYKYGIVLRYPTDKASVTGNDFEPWHFRYVGVAHAIVMHEKNYCLEEYLDFIKDYTYEGRHLIVMADDGTQYELYYIPASDEESTAAHLPTNKPYEITGNNSDGYIVTVTNN